MSGLSAEQLLLLAAAAVLAGFAKTAIGGAGALSVAIFAAVLPARESTGALLPLLLVGDVVAVASYRQHAEWTHLLRLFPSVAVGIVLGAVFIANVDDTVMRRTIGALLIVLVAVHLWQRRNPKLASADGGDGRRRARALGFGVLAGFTTMVANAAGAVMAVYLLSAGLGMATFLGTTAWFFLIVNAFKIPFTVGLGLISFESLTLDAWLAPAVLLGAAVGRATIRRLAPARFEQLVLVFVVLSSLNLLR